MALIDDLMKQLSGGALDTLGRQIGADGKTAGAAASAAIPVLLGTLARNASNDEGAAALHAALDKDHDGGILDNVEGFLGNGGSGPGEGILGHLLGGKRSAVEAGLSRATGLDSGAVGKLLVSLAPVVMGALGKAQRSRSMGVADLAGFLGGEKDQLRKSAPAGIGGLEKLLDSDGDGDVDFGDFAKKGSGILGKLLGG